MGIWADASAGGVFVMICSYEDQCTNPPIGALAVPSAAHLFKHQSHVCNTTTNAQLNTTSTSKASNPRPMQNSQQRIILHIGIIPIPPPPRPPGPPPPLAGLPPKLLPLLLLLVDLLFVKAWPLPVPPDAFLFVFHPPRDLLRPLLPPRRFEIS